MIHIAIGVALGIVLAHFALQFWASMSYRAMHRKLAKDRARDLR